MVGCELCDNDEWTVPLLTNPEVLRVLNNSHSGRQLYRFGPHIAWTAEDEDGSRYLALFNTHVIPARIETSFSKLGLSGMQKVRDVWKREDQGEAEGSIVVEVPAHGARLLTCVIHRDSFNDKP
jgi:hypothetical protein